MGIADKKSRKPGYITMLAQEEQPKEKIVHRSYYITEEQDEKIKELAFRKKIKTSAMMKIMIDSYEE